MSKKKGDKAPMEAVSGKTRAKNDKAPEYKPQMYLSGAHANGLKNHKPGDKVDMRVQGKVTSKTDSTDAQANSVNVELHKIGVAPKGKRGGQ